jgi:putative hydrolase of the HAD superfamily
MNPSPVRAVAFDAVGTLIHPEPSAAEVYLAVGGRFGSRLTLAEIRGRFAAAFAEQEQFDALGNLATNEERELRRWRTIVSRVLDDVTNPAACFAELYEHFARPDAWRCEPETAHVLAQLRDAGYPIALASNYDHRLHTVIAGLEPLASIKSVIISSEIGWRKPSEHFFAHLAGTLNVPPAAVLYLGDDLVNDFQGAQQAGMQTMLFDPRGRHPELGDARLGKLGELRMPRIV